MCVKPPFSPWWRYWMRCASTWVSDSSRTLSEAQTFSMNVVDSVLEEIVVDGHHGVLLPVWISPSFSCLTPVQRVYREVSEGELRVRKSGKLPLALPQRRDFPLLRPRVSVWFFPNKTLSLQTQASISHQRLPIFFHIQKPNDWIDLGYFQLCSATCHMTLNLFCWHKIH